MKLKTLAYAWLVILIVVVGVGVISGIKIASSYNKDKFDENYPSLKTYTYTDYKDLSNTDKELIDNELDKSPGFDELKKLYIREKNTENVKELLKMKDEKKKSYESARDLTITLYKFRQYMCTFILSLIGIFIVAHQSCIISNMD